MPFLSILGTPIQQGSGAEMDEGFWGRWWRNEEEGRAAMEEGGGESEANQGMYALVPEVRERSGDERGKGKGRYWGETGIGGDRMTKRGATLGQIREAASARRRGQDRFDEGMEERRGRLRHRDRE